MSVLYSRAPTIYAIDPHAFHVNDLVNETLKTAGTQTIQLMAVRKGTCVINSWVDVTTAAGVNGPGSSINMQEGVTVTFVQTFNANTPGITFGPVTDTGYDSIGADGVIQLTKAGLGTAFVCSLFVLMIRPNMNP